jgi:hypothetical protein
VEGLIQDRLLELAQIQIVEVDLSSAETSVQEQTDVLARLQEKETELRLILDAQIEEMRLIDL